MQVITPRLILREYVAADEARFLAYQTDPRAREFYPPAPEEHAPGQALVSLFIQWAAEVPRRNWQLAIAERAQPEALIGSVGLRCAGLAPTAAEFGLELAPVLGPALWQRGGPSAPDVGFHLAFTHGSARHRHLRERPRRPARAQSGLPGGGGSRVPGEAGVAGNAAAQRSSTRARLVIRIDAKGD